eukprot:CFRG3050T1
MYAHMYDEEMPDMQDFTEFTMAMTNSAMSFLATFAPLVSGAGMHTALAAYSIAKSKAASRLQNNNVVGQLQNPFEQQVLDPAQPLSDDYLASLTPGWSSGLDLNSMLNFNGVDGAAADILGQSFSNSKYATSDSGHEDVITIDTGLKRSSSVIDEMQEVATSEQTRASVSSIASKKHRRSCSQSSTDIMLSPCGDGPLDVNKSENETVDGGGEMPAVPPEHKGPPHDLSPQLKLPDVANLRLDSFVSGSVEQYGSDKHADHKVRKQATYNEDKASEDAAVQKDKRMVRKNKRRTRTKEQLERCRQESARARERKKVERTKLEKVVESRDDKIQKLNSTVESLQQEVQRMRTILTQRAMNGLSDPIHSQRYAKMLHDISQSPLTLAQEGMGANMATSPTSMASVPRVHPNMFNFGSAGVGMGLGSKVPSGIDLGVGPNDLNNITQQPSFNLTQLQSTPENLFGGSMDLSFLPNPPSSGSLRTIAPRSESVKSDT